MSSHSLWHSLISLSVVSVTVFITLCAHRIDISFQTIHRKKRIHIFSTMNWKIIRLIFPLSLAMFFSKLFTYVSYSYVPVSLTHTVKALQPLFNVLISYFFEGRTVSHTVLLSLLPIVVGVAYSSFNDIQYRLNSLNYRSRFNIIGFICALISTLTGVSQSIYVKRLLRYGIDKDYVCIWKHNWGSSYISWTVWLRPWSSSPSCWSTSVWREATRTWTGQRWLSVPSFNISLPFRLMPY